MRRAAVPAAVIALCAAVVALIVFGVAAKSPDTSLDQAVAAGDRPAAPAADRRLPALDGAGTKAIRDLRGKVVVLNFWASWCEPCRAEAPALERTQRKLAGAEGTVLGVDWNDAMPDARHFTRQYGITYPVVRDVGGKLAKAYGVTGLPETFVIDRDGRVAALQRFSVNERFLRHVLAPLTPPPA